MNMPAPEFRPHNVPAAPRAAASPVMRGADMVVRALLAEGVTSVWGYPGGAVLPIYDAIATQDGLRHLLVRHEQAAVHAADGFARASGQVGVALVTSGPGVTNAVTGIATAYFDSIPLVVLSGNVPTAMIGEDAFQECDAVGITRPIVKHNFLVRDVAELPVTLKKAFHLARTGRPGPVLVDIRRTWHWRAVHSTTRPPSTSGRTAPRWTATKARSARRQGCCARRAVPICTWAVARSPLKPQPKSPHWRGWSTRP